MIRVYTDASRGEFVSGVGYVIEGEVNTSGRRIFDERLTSMEAEFLGLVEGLRIASQRSQSREYCEAYSDAKPLIDKMRGDEKREGEWRDYYDSCHWLLGKFDDWDLHYCSRQDNEDAHNLARRALKEGRNRDRNG